MSKKQMYSVNSREKNESKIGTIKGMDVLMHRAGRVSLGLNPEIKGGVHKSKRDYDRKREKAILRKTAHEGRS